MEENSQREIRKKNSWSRNLEAEIMEGSSPREKLGRRNHGGEVMEEQQRRRPHEAEIKVPKLSQNGTQWCHFGKPQKLAKVPTSIYIHSLYARVCSKLLNKRKWRTLCEKGSFLTPGVECMPRRRSGKEVYHSILWSGRWYEIHSAERKQQQSNINLRFFENLDFWVSRTILIQSGSNCHRIYRINYAKASNIDPNLSPRRLGK